MLLGKQVRWGLRLDHFVILTREPAVEQWGIKLLRIEEKMEEEDTETLTTVSSLYGFLLLAVLA